MLYLKLMLVNSKLNIAIFFTIIFVGLISAPTIILAFDNSVDVSSFYSINEEEEHHHVKLVFENSIEVVNALVLLRLSTQSIGYPFKTYSKPHLNLRLPPPQSMS